MGIYDEKLGEYKVALSVDYKRFNEDMKSAMDMMTKTATLMNNTAEDLAMALQAQFAGMTKAVNTGVESMKSDINGLMDTLKGGKDIKGFSDSLEGELKRTTANVKRASDEAVKQAKETTEKIVSEYTKRTRLRSKGASEVAETGAVSDETIKAYNEVDTNIKKSETSLNAIRKAQNDLNKLAEQYNAIQQKVSNTITAQSKLSETTLASYRSQIANILQEHQRLRSMIGDKATDDFMPKRFLPNLLEKGGAYEQNAKKVDEERTRASLHKEMIALLNQRVKSEQKLSDIKAKQAQDADKQRIKDEAKETKKRTEALRAQLQAEQEIANLKAKQVRESEAKRIKEEEEARKANTAAIKAQIEARIKESAEIARQIKLITEQTIKEKEAAAKKFSSGLFSQLEEVGRAEQKYRELIQQFNNHVNAKSLSPLQFEKMKAAIAETTEKLEAFRQAGRKLQVNPINILEGKTFEDFSKSLVPATNRLNFFADSLKSLKHHIAWMASATVMGATLAIPASTVSTLKDVERLMAGMKQVNHDVATSQTVLAKTTQQLIGISDTYAQKVDDIIKAAEHKRPIAA